MRVRVHRTKRLHTATRHKTGQSYAMAPKRKSTELGDPPAMEMGDCARLPLCRFSGKRGSRGLESDLLHLRGKQHPQTISSGLAGDRIRPRLIVTAAGGNDRMSATGRFRTVK